jgi:hypothetical protein
MFGYKGTFQVEYLPVSGLEQIPKDVLPLRACLKIYILNYKPIFCTNPSAFFQTIALLFFSKRAGSA